MRKFEMILCLVALVLTFALAPSALSAGVPDWSAFDAATFTGITVDASPDGLSYVLSLSGAPTLTVGGNTYDVTWCQGFFLLDPTGVDTILSSEGGSPAGWGYNTKPGNEPFSVVGWTATGSSPRLLPGVGSKTFTLSSFDAPEGVIYGYHLGYRTADGGTGIMSVVTHHFKDTPVPEPGSLVVAATMLAGTVVFVRRRRQPE
jgi:hypothetical protein